MKRDEKSREKLLCSKISRETPASSTAAWHSAVGPERHCKAHRVNIPCFRPCAFGIQSAAKCSRFLDEKEMCLSRDWCGTVGRCWTMLDDVGRCWTMLDDVGRCWTMLDDVGRCWTMLDDVGRCDREAETSCPAPEWLWQIADPGRLPGTWPDYSTFLQVRHSFYEDYEV